jgi:PAS domain S-box-containing protein
MQVWAGRLRLGITMAVMLFCLIAMALLVREVRAKLAALQNATSDNTQWVMMQTEVEVLRLQAAVKDAIENPSPAALDEVRRWFNVFYSRVAMLEQSALYAPLLSQPDYSADHARLRAFLDETVPLIDAPDTRLAAALADIGPTLPDMRAAAREMTLNSLSDFAAQSDLTRESISLTLVRLALVTGALVLIVAGVAVILAVQFRRSEAHKRALSDTGARLSTIVATSADGIVVTDLDGIIREFNPAAETIFGLPATAARGQDAPTLLLAEGPDGPQQLALIAALRDPAADTTHPVRIEVDARRADGSSFPAEVSIARSQIAEAGLVVAFIRDISDRRQAQSALTRALDQAKAGEKAKAEFLAVMSHEMRTPLNGLMGSMELLRRTTIDTDQRELLSVMEASGDILLGHVNSVLDVSRAEAGNILPDSIGFDLDRLLEDTVANQASLATAGGNRISLLRPSGSLGRVTGDPGRLRQILLNLIGNAVKFTQGGEIGVEADRLPGPGALVEIRVSDTGIGIDEADLDRIFDDFVTLDASYGRSVGGTGLGLGIARRLAAAMKGEIGVESIPGEGSLFWLRLPLPPEGVTAAARHPASSQSAEPISDGEDPPLGPQLSVLLVEDNAINRFLLRRFLESGGHSVTEAVDGIEAVDCATTTAFDVILMDISMPRMDGIAATQAIRSGNGPSSTARILALTAHALPQERARFQAAGIEATLTKPIARLPLLRALAGELPTEPPAHATGETAAVNTPVIDAASLADLIRHVGPQTGQKLITRLIADGDAVMGNLAAFDPATDAAEMVALCHRLSGSSGTFGTYGLRTALLAAETSLKLQIEAETQGRETSDETSRDVTNALAALPAVWRETRSRLKAELASLDAAEQALATPDVLRVTPL